MPPASLPRLEEQACLAACQQAPHMALTLNWDLNSFMRFFSSYRARCSGVMRFSFSCIACIAGPGGHENNQEAAASILAWQETVYVSTWN
jgi:hypothetical protein